MATEWRRVELQRAISRLLQVAIGVLLLVGLLAGNLGIVVNAVVALGVTFLPAVLERDYSLPLNSTHTLWLTLAVFLHTLGMTGLYREVWWWDHVTHTLSATVVAAAGYAAVSALDEYSDAVRFTDRFLFVFIVLFTVGLGVFWEVLEFAARELADVVGADPVLVQYGLEDTIVDLVFDMVGAVLLALFGTNELSDLVEDLTERYDGAWNSRTK
ncbi:hypothetical protein [Halomarina oriensis]|uniref:DUF2238 domain-containing protein n=1 Tax=Halomarina oriensis TaxID=671145 RepID=A0A6B0GLL9_9EURY|nr:hypothetical protein [Halomarina oriensis]MWG34359.1 hypothetical protein [Halomarina oriensis]